MTWHEALLEDGETVVGTFRESILLRTWVETHTTRQKVSHNRVRVTRHRERKRSYGHVDVVLTDRRMLRRGLLFAKWVNTARIEEIPVSSIARVELKDLGEDCLLRWTVAIRPYVGRASETTLKQDEMTPELIAWMRRILKQEHRSALPHPRAMAAHRAAYDAILEEAQAEESVRASASTRTPIFGILGVPAAGIALISALVLLFGWGEGRPPYEATELAFLGVCAAFGSVAGLVTAGCMVYVPWLIVRGLQARGRRDEALDALVELLATPIGSEPPEPPEDSEDDSWRGFPYAHLDEGEPLVLALVGGSRPDLVFTDRKVIRRGVKLAGRAVDDVLPLSSVKALDLQLGKRVPKVVLRPFLGPECEVSVFHEEDHPVLKQLSERIAAEGYRDGPPDPKVLRERREAYRTLLGRARSSHYLAAAMAWLVAPAAAAMWGAALVIGVFSLTELVQGFSAGAYSMVKGAIVHGVVATGIGVVGFVTTLITPLLFWRRAVGAGNWDQTLPEILELVADEIPGSGVVRGR